MDTVKKSTTPSRSSAVRSLRIGSRLGKYRLEKRLGRGGFATVYAAHDTLLGIKVALKIPDTDSTTPELIDELRREVRLTMKLEHPGILPIRDAYFIDGHFVIVMPLAVRTLADRLQKRIRFATAFDLIEQLLSAVAHAHHCGVIHCDIKPENILFVDKDRIRLTDFGIAKMTYKTINGGGTGTVGYMAPEQAMGRPSARSDVFSIGLLAYRMLSGTWPEYPFEWPMAGASQLRKRVHPDLIAIIRKSLEIAPRKRFRDADQMLEKWSAVRQKALRFAKRSSS